VEIARRQFLEQVFGAQLALSLVGACGPERERALDDIPGALLGQDVAAGHLLRGDLRERLAHVATLPKLHTSVLIAGGGPAGLTAAYTLEKAELTDFVLLELEPVLGGTSRGDASAVTRYPWGAHYLPVPHAHNTALVKLLRELAVVSGVDDTGKLLISEPHLVRAPEERLFYKGYWYPGLYLDAGASAADREERARFGQQVARWVAYRDGQGRRAFTLPTRLCSDAPEVRALDRLSCSAWLSRESLHSPRLRWLCDYACRDDYGLSLEQTSAWALLFYFAARIEQPGDEASDLLTWPEGNAALVRHLARAAEGRTRSRTVVLDVRDHGTHVELLGWDLDRDQGVRYQAEQAIVATPRFVRDRVVQAPLAAREPASYAPWLVANLHLRERPTSRGAQLAWDNVLHDSPSLGYVCATHQRGSDYGPTVLTYYLPLIDGHERGARQKLFDGGLAAWREAIMLDLERAHPGLRRQVARLDVFRWGHAMVSPRVGSVWSAARLDAQRAQGRLHFAHSDLSGVSLFEEAFDHGVRAAGEVLTQLGRVSLL
jgi:monoamine oxidase